MHNVHSCKASGRVNFFEMGGSGLCSAVAVSGQIDVFTCHRCVQLGTPGSERDEAAVWGAGRVLPTN